MMLFMCGCVGDCLSINDISVAFLQADEFPEGDKRYVSYTAYKGAVEHILRLHGCLYGQRCASNRGVYGQRCVVVLFLHSSFHSMLYFPVQVNLCFHFQLDFLLPVLVFLTRAH